MRRKNRRIKYNGDSCAIVALMDDEDSAGAYEAKLLKATSPFTSALAAWEAINIVSRPDQLKCAFIAIEGAVVEWLEASGIRLREPGSLAVHFPLLLPWLKDSV